MTSVKAKPVREEADAAGDTPWPMDEAVRQSLAYSHEVTRQRARNFYYGLKLTPEPKRSAVYAIYAFMRACDDLADGDEPDQNGQNGRPHPADPTDTARRIEAFRATMQQVLDAPAGQPLPEGPVWPALRYVVHRYRIDPAHLHAMLDGQRRDLIQHRYETFDQLYEYCYQVASVVGLVCLSIWGYDGDPHALKLAEYRGIALQLTNILRDLAEDAERGRIYLPAEELAQFGYPVDDLAAGVTNERFDRLMTRQIERARSYYEMSAALEQHLDPACAPTSWAMTRIYHDLLERIAQDPRQVLQKRVRLGPWRKLRIALGANWRRRWGA